ncbi:MAG: guanylate kinase [Phycisphaerales bacterium]|jgi:guanylate kinase|nr:guanylate kinase [Phycisphaerales bacterium]
MSSNSKQGALIVISGPSGVGKTTIVHRVREELHAVFSVSATTRPKSDRETDGVDYYFITNEKFEALVQEHAFLEHAEVFHCHRYGTLREPVNKVLAEGGLMLLDIDVQGGIQVRDNMKESLRFFILPPSEEELLRRLTARGRDDEDAIRRRFSEAKQEIALARSSGAYDFFIVNDTLELAVAETVAIINTCKNAAQSSS